MVEKQDFIEELDTLVNYELDHSKEKGQMDDISNAKKFNNEQNENNINLDTPVKPVTPKRIKGSIIDDEFHIEVPDGWKRQIVQRQGGLSAGKCDVYYFSPLGKKLRSKKEVQNHCELKDLQVNIDLFKFNHSVGKVSKKIKLFSPKTPKNLDSPKSQRKKSTISPKKLDKDLVKRKKNIKTPLNINDGMVKKRKKSVWVPPKSPFNLFQEALFQNPWKLLLGTIFFSKSSGDNTLRSSLFWNFLKQWSNPEAAMKADWQDVSEFLKPLTISEKMAKMIIKFSEEFLSKTWVYPKELHGIGKYGNDSYKVFCINEWKKVKPTDFLLTFYVDWLWDNYKVLGLD